MADEASITPTNIALLWRGAGQPLLTRRVGDGVLEKVETFDVADKKNHPDIISILSANGVLVDLWRRESRFGDVGVITTNMLKTALAGAPAGDDLLTRVAREITASDLPPERKAQAVASLASPAAPTHAEPAATAKVTGKPRRQKGRLSAAHRRQSPATARGQLQL